ncbi:glucosamine-6-phosphate deaminase [Candidatus Bipolaricaulota bacterium]|nr:glucosamine-6-phosphate deaminase [Candidatus Bipolaricaulota bacterium]
MDLNIYDDKVETSKKAANRAATLLRGAIEDQGQAVFVLATGVSQLEFLSHLTEIDYVDWSKTTALHLDEYVGLSPDHRASFRKYLDDNFFDKVNISTVHKIKGERENPKGECARLNDIVKDLAIDVAFLGIGENGHIAFNDPPADFDTDDPYIVVELDKRCREQQVGEGWFDSVEDVPKKAISMSVRQIMRAHNIVCTVPGKRKAEAVETCLTGKVSPERPASILHRHDSAYIYLDRESASLLDEYE